MDILLRLLLAALLFAAVACSSDTPTAPAPELTLGRTVGVNTHYASGSSIDHDALALLAEAGVTFIRNDLNWDSVEQERGVYDFVGSGFDELVESCESLGIRVMFILDYGNALYGESRAVVDDEGRQAFAAFAAAAASRYGGRGHSWEIWNEPNIDQFWSSSRGGPDPVLYSELVRVTAPALRAADPDGDIVVGAVFYSSLSEIIEALGMGLTGPNFLSGIVESGVLSLADEVSLHFYRMEAPEDVKADVDQARDMLRSAGYDLPISSGEWGYSTYDPEAPADGINFLPAVTENRQASYLARMLLFNYSLGLPGTVIFKDVDARNPSPGNIEHHWGLMTGDLEPKPSYFAVQTLTELLGDANPAGVFMLGPGKHMLSFHRKDGLFANALWAEQTATWSLRAESGAAEARVLGRDGTDITPEGLSDGVQLTVESDDGPIYLLGEILVGSAN